MSEVVNEVEQEIDTVTNDVVAEVEKVEADAKQEIAKAETAVKAEAEAGLTAEEKLAIRDAQLTLAKIENDYRTLQAKSQELLQKIEHTAQTAAQRLGKSLNDFILDIESLEFRLRSEVVAATRLSITKRSMKGRGC